MQADGSITFYFHELMFDHRDNRMRSVIEWSFEEITSWSDPNFGPRQHHYVVNCADRVQVLYPTHVVKQVIVQLNSEEYTSWKAERDQAIFTAEVEAELQRVRGMN